MTLQQVAGNSLAGYRLVRKLGAGSRADVFLGAGQTGTVALKVFHPDVQHESIGNELDAVGRLDSPHFVRLVDVASTEDETPILILERVQRGSVAALLRDRDALERGEVVTLIAPLAGVLPTLHRLGVGHGRIGASSVHLGAGGEPVLLGFGHCDLFGRDGSIAAVDAEPAAAWDRESLAALTIALLSRVRDAATDTRVVRLIEWIDAAPREYEFVERLESRLFDFAEPVAIDFGPKAPATTGLPARFGMADRVVTLPEPVAGQTIEVAAGLLGRLDTLLRDNPVDLVRTRAFGLARGIRKPFWVAAGAVVLALILALALLPQGSSPESSPAVATPPPVAPTVTEPALPGDPVLALPILLAARTGCIRSLSVLCLDGVDDQSSSAYSADAALIEQLQGGSEIPKSAIITAAGPTLVETLGDSAILSLGPNSNPASVLMIRAEAGWRIRGYLSGIQATRSPVATN
jgi:serine/threonine protein kinase